MKIDVFHWVKFNSLISLYLFIISTRFISIVDCNNSVTPTTPTRQMCTQIQSMLSLGKYRTYQMSSNITYVSRVYAQNFLAYSFLDNVLIFIEPKHQLHVYNAQTMHLIVNITTGNVVYATSCMSLTSDNLYGLYFVSESRLKTKLVSIRVCQVGFNLIQLAFEEKKCIETLIIPCNTPDIRVNGFTIKRDHAGTKKSILFVSTDIGLIYTIFNTTTGSLISEPIVLNDTLNEGSVVVTSSGIVYYANKQEHTIHEIHITRDFRIKYGKIIKSNAIKSPFGLIADECDHLYIATKSMILVMFIEKYTTIRSVFSRASDLPISIERLNASTYVYPTVKKYSNRSSPVWLFNFLSFSEPEKSVNTTPIPVDQNQNGSDFQIAVSNNDLQISTTSAEMLSPYVTSIINSLETTESNTQSSTSASTDVSDRYSQLSISTTQETDKEKSNFSSSLSTEVSTEYLHSSISTSTTLEVTSTVDSTTAMNEPSTTLAETPTFSTTEVTSNLLEATLRTTSEYLSDTTILPFLTSSDQSTSQMNVETTVIENQFHLITTETSDNNTNDDFYTESTGITDSTINSFSDKVTDDGITQKYSSSMLVEVDIASTLHSSSPFELSNTDSISSPTTSSQSPLSLDSSLAQSSTISTKLIRLLSSKYFSETTTTASTLPTTFSSSISTIETTDSDTTSDTTEQSSMITTFSDESSTSSLTTSYPDDTSSFTDFISSESTSTDYVTPSTIIDSTTMLDSTTTSQTDEPSTVPFETTEADQELTTTGSLPPEKTTALLTTDESSTEYTSTSTEASLEITSTVFPDTYTPKIEYSTLVVTSLKPRSQNPPRRRTSSSATTSTTTTTMSRKQELTLQKPSLLTTTTTSTTTTSTDTPETTSFYHELSTSSPIYFWPPQFNSLLQQQMVIIKPTVNTNLSNTLLSNELLQALFNSTSNSSDEKLIYFNLADLPPSSWNVSLHTNESILLAIILPPATYPSTLNSTTNLSITNVDARRFSTSIVGIPINLLVDQIQTKQFSLAMNLTNDQINQSISDVVIGHIKSEKFELNITKSDNLNLHVEQVDSETAELYFDSKFCTNETNLQINLNISKNGTIRYGDRTPLRIGPVFTRVHMLKQSCDLDQPFTLFFDICQGANPCLNGGTCQSKVPNYNDPSFSQRDSSQINYQCICPARTSGEHCQYSQYPIGYCINGGTLLSSLDSTNETIVTCLCAPGFQGEHCEDNTDDCLNVHCSNHGICQDGIQTYSCSCFEGFYGSQCEQRTVETVVLQVASKSFASIAILVIAGIAGLIVASDIHTYLTRKQNTSHRLGKPPRATSEVFENSVLLLAFGDAPIEMSDLSTVDRPKKPSATAKRPAKKTKNQARYEQISERRYTKTLEKPPSKPRSSSNSSYETIL